MTTSKFGHCKPGSELITLLRDLSLAGLLSWNQIELFIVQYALSTFVIPPHRPTFNHLATPASIVPFDLSSSHLAEIVQLLTVPDASLAPSGEVFAIAREQIVRVLADPTAGAPDHLTRRVLQVVDVFVDLEGAGIDHLLTDTRDVTVHLSYSARVVNDGQLVVRRLDSEDDRMVPVARKSAPRDVVTCIDFME